MTARALRALTIAAAVVVLVDLGVGAVAVVVGASAETPWILGVGSSLSLFCVAMGGLVSLHEPRSPVGPALAWTAAAISLTHLLETVAASAYAEASLPGAALLRPLWNGVWTLQLAGLLALLLVFPSGRLPGLAWRLVPWAFAVSAVVVAAGTWGGRRVDGRTVGGSSTELPTIGVSGVGLCLVLAVASLVLRYRRGSDLGRLQIRWLILAGVFVVALLMAGWGLEALGAPLGVAYTPFLVAIVVAVPLAVTGAVVRHDLFDVDRLLSATAAWAITLLVSAGVFAFIIVTTTQVVRQRTGWGSATAAFVTALALLPAHRVISRFVGRVVDRDRYVAVAAVERFASDVRAGRRQPEEVEEVLREAQGDPDVKLHLVGPSGGWIGLDGAVSIDPVGVTVEARGDAVARLELGRDSARARRRIADLAKAAWVPIEVSRLRLVMRTALDEATASRARLAEATVAERRRLERVLHDGAQQRLVATGLRLRMLQPDLGPHQSAEVELAVDELEATVGELRRLANGIRPERLDDGLHAALGGVRESSPLPFDLVVDDDLPEVDDVRTLTAYLVVSEAVANVLKHARASRIDVRVGVDGDRLALRVRDDGIGGVSAYDDLTALRDRVLSVGGDLLVESPRGQGTTITALL